VYDAQAALTQAETNAVNSKYDYFIALAQLDRVTGKR
jgi:outer membrane protein TolC